MSVGRPGLEWSTSPLTELALVPQLCLVLIPDEMGIAYKVPNTLPGALPLPSDIFSCGHDSERFSEGQEAGVSTAASTPMAHILPKAIAHQVVFETGDA